MRTRGIGTRLRFSKIAALDIHSVPLTFDPVIDIFYVQHQRMRHIAPFSISLQNSFVYKIPDIFFFFLKVIYCLPRTRTHVRYLCIEVHSYYHFALKVFLALVSSSGVKCGRCSEDDLPTKKFNFKDPTRGCAHIIVRLHVHGSHQCYLLF